MGASKSFWTVTCNTHGVMDTKSIIKWVKVSQPKHKKQQFFGGYPRCNAERIAREREERRN